MIYHAQSFETVGENIFLMCEYVCTLLLQAFPTKY